MSEQPIPDDTPREVPVPKPESNLDKLRREAYERHIDWLERNEPR